MKTSWRILFLFAGIIIFQACENIITDNSVSFPPSKDNNENILSMSDSAKLIADKPYTMIADLGNDAHVSIKFTNLNIADSAYGKIPIWFYSENTGWQITVYDEIINQQIFKAEDGGQKYLNIQFFSWGLKGACNLEVELNDATIIYKTLFWE